MKKILQTGLIVSSLVSSLMAENEHVEVMPDGKMQLTFKAPFSNPVFALRSPNIEAQFAVSLENSDNNEYAVMLQHKGPVHACGEVSNIPFENLYLQMGNPTNGGEMMQKVLPYQPCYNDDNNNDEYHYETEHPYANNTHTVKVLPALCGDGETCINPVGYAKIVGEIEKNYDFLTVYQGGELIGQFDGVLDTDLPINGNLPLEIHFDSDYIVTKNGLTIDLHY